MIWRGIEGPCPTSSASGGRTSTIRYVANWFWSTRWKRISVWVALFAAVNLIRLAITGHDDVFSAIFIGVIFIGTFELVITWASRHGRSAP